MPIDSYMTYDFLIPGVLLMWSGELPARDGDEARLRARRDWRTRRRGVTFTSQAVTPMAAKTSRYFFSWGPRRDHGDEALRDS